MQQFPGAAVTFGFGALVVYLVLRGSATGKQLSVLQAVPWAVNGAQEARYRQVFEFRGLRTTAAASMAMASAGVQADTMWLVAAALVLCCPAALVFPRPSRVPQKHPA